jgi:hypothetical protein
MSIHVEELAAMLAAIWCLTKLWERVLVKKITPPTFRVQELS